MITSNRKLNILFYSLVVLAILALGVLLLPFKAHADVAGYVTGYNTNMGSGERYNYIVGQNVPSVVYYPSAPIIVYRDNPVVLPAPQTIITNTSTTSKSTNATASNKSTEDGTSLAASVIFGEKSFMPSSIVQWILFAILILVIVILTRKIFGGEKEFHSTPMKHA